MPQKKNVPSSVVVGAVVWVVVVVSDDGSAVDEAVDVVGVLVDDKVVSLMTLVAIVTETPDGEVGQMYITGTSGQ